MLADWAPQGSTLDEPCQGRWKGNMPRAINMVRESGDRGLDIVGRVEIFHFYSLL